MLHSARSSRYQGNGARLFYCAAYNYASTIVCASKKRVEKTPFFLSGCIMFNIDAIVRDGALERQVRTSFVRCANREWAVAAAERDGRRGAKGSPAPIARSSFFRRTKKNLDRCEIIAARRHGGSGCCCSLCSTFVFFFSSPCSPCIFEPSATLAYLFSKDLSRRCAALAICNARIKATIQLRSRARCAA